MSRPQFTLRALLVAMLVVAAFFGGMVLQKRIDAPVPARIFYLDGPPWITEETMTTPDGKLWTRRFEEPESD